MAGVRALDRAGYDAPEGGSRGFNIRTGGSHDTRCLDAGIRLLMEVTNTVLGKITGCEYHSPQRGAPPLKLASSGRATRLRQSASGDPAHVLGDSATAASDRRQATNRCIAAAYHVLAPCCSPLDAAR